MNKNSSAFAMLIILFSAFPMQAHAVGAVDGGGISKVYLSCDNKQHPSISYSVDIISGFFTVDGRKTWTTGAQIRSQTHFSNQETLLASMAVRANGSLTEVEGDNFSLVQSGPGNFNMKSFPAAMTLTLDNGNEISADLLCTLR